MVEFLNDDEKYVNINFINRYRDRINNIDFNVDKEPIDDLVWKAFTKFFREVKGYDDWTDEQIENSMNNDDFIEFFEYIRKWVLR